MSKIKNGDMPAMPTQVNGGDIYGGLTKREYFAGLAMQGLLANAYWNEPEYGPRTPESVAIASEEYADALLKELNNES